jgi:dihydrofolate reductase
MKMRKVALFMHTSLDGFVQGPDKWDINWISYDQDLVEFGDEVVSLTGSPVYGRVTYEGMKGYWPTVIDNPDSSKHDIEHATWLENATKVVVSNSMEKADWNNTILINDNVVEEITKLKQMPGKDLVIFGSPMLSHYFMQHDLIDEFWLTVSPIVLGDGIPLFKDIKARMKLNLLETRSLKSGVVTLKYKVIKE